jgi:DNA-binding HxlR family transcriptional regulator
MSANVSERRVSSPVKALTQGTRRVGSDLRADADGHTEATLPGGVTVDQEMYCPYFHHAVELIGRRWTGVVLAALSQAPMRYSHLRSQIPGLSDRLLTERLTELEAEGIVDRTNPVGSPLYQLTPFGRELIPVIDAIKTFAHASAVRMGELERPGRRHDAKPNR